MDVAGDVDEVGAKFWRYRDCNHATEKKVVGQPLTIVGHGPGGFCVVYNSVGLVEGWPGGRRFRQLNNGDIVNRVRLVANFLRVLRRLKWG